MYRLQAFWQGYTLMYGLCMVQSVLVMCMSDRTQILLADCIQEDALPEALLQPQ